MARALLIVADVAVGVVNLIMSLIGDITREVLWVWRRDK